MLVKSKYNPFGKFPYLFMVAIILLNCSSSGPTGSTATTLADQIVGNFKGTLQNPGGNIPDYLIIVTEINNTRVNVASASGGSSATFVVDLESEVSGNITSIILKSPDDILENNGTFVASTGKLSYAFQLGGNDDYNIEVFLGDKQ